LNILEELTAITLKPIKLIKFTNEFDPIPFPGIDVGQGISGVIKDLSEVGLEVLDRGTQLVENVVDKGIKCFYTASIICGIVLLLIAYKYFKSSDADEAKVNTLTEVQLHPHIWKYYDKY